MAPFLPETLEHLFDSHNPINAATVQALLRAYGHPHAAAWHQWQARFGRLPAARLVFARFASEAQDNEFTLLGDCRLTLGEERSAWRGLAALETIVCQAASRGWPPATAAFELGALVIVTRQTGLLEDLGRLARYYRYRLLGQAAQPCYLVNLVPRQMEELEDLLDCIGRYQPLQAGYAASARPRLAAGGLGLINAHLKGVRDCWI